MEPTGRATAGRRRGVMGSSPPSATVVSRLVAGMMIGVVVLGSCSSGGIDTSVPSTASRSVDRPDATSAPPTMPETGSAPARPVTETSCRDEASGPTTYAYAERPGVDPNLTSVDVYLPEGCGPVPVVMWVHGGGWRRGDKASGEVERKAAWAASLGAALVSVNYRLTTPDSGVRWPDHGEDVAAAVTWVQQQGPALGLEATDITLLGHSAGAHLVAIVGTDPTLLTEAGADPGEVSCVVALDFSFDLARAPAAKLIADAFGTDPAVVAAASPNVQIERNGPPSARFLVGTRGASRRVADAQAFVDLVNDAGGSAELLDATPYTHNQINSQLGAPDDTLVTPAVSEFVLSC